MVRAGNVDCRKVSDLPEVIPVFPLAGALLLPSGRLPLNIFEQRYLDMIGHALAGPRLIGMVQPRLGHDAREACAMTGEPELCDVGCAGRIVSVAETGDGRYLVSLEGICRFHRIGKRHPFDSVASRRLPKILTKTAVQPAWIVPG